MVCNYMRSELRWGVSDFIKALASSKGSNSAHQKSAFVTAAYKDEEVLKSESYFGDADELWDGTRQSLIVTLDLGNNELRREVKRLGAIEPFSKYNPNLKSGESALDMHQT